MYLFRSPLVCGTLSFLASVTEWKPVTVRDLAVAELLMDYDGSDTTKDKLKRITITLNEKLATLKTLDESILAAIDKGN